MSEDRDDPLVSSNSPPLAPDVVPTGPVKWGTRKAGSGDGR